MPTVSRADLHRAVEQLPDNRLAAAADLLEALRAQDRRVQTWREGLSTAEEADIAASLGRDYARDEWISDEALGEWLANAGTITNRPPPRGPSV
jgi:hypothetical protein